MARRGIEVAPAKSRPSAAPRRTRVVIRKVGPWTVFRWSLLFYFCTMLIFLLAFFFIYLFLESSGALDDFGKLLAEFKIVEGECRPIPGTAQLECVAKIDGTWLFTRLFILGTVWVVIWSVINLLIALLYNLVSDVLGGIELTLVERR
ncbi:MAG: DUF3566 domain-containing protein [Actinomycetota bacterium]